MFSSLLGVPSHSGSKTHKHGSRRSTSSTSTSTGHSKPKSSPSAQQRPVAVPGTISASFLFVVNELQVDYEPASPQEQPLTDQWLNMMPPQHAGAYVGEIVGTVFRYRDGVVSPAHGYVWWVGCFSLFSVPFLFPKNKSRKDGETVALRCLASPKSSPNPISYQP